MKQCTMKNCITPINKQEFNKNKVKKDGLNTICRDCSKARSRKYYNENTEEHKKNVGKRTKVNRLLLRSRLLTYLKTHPCVDCGLDNPIVLEFDHVKGKKRS